MFDKSDEFSIFNKNSTPPSERVRARASSGSFLIFFTKELLIFQLTPHNIDRTIIEGLQDIVSVLEDHLKPLVQAEMSVLVDTLYRPELLFPGIASNAFFNAFPIM